MGDALYNKVCRLESCHKPFTSTSRNQKYHSDECLAASRIVHRSRGKRRRAYRKDAPNRRAQSMSRDQARAFAINELIWTMCQGCSKMLQVKDIETHHRDGDPFHNNLQNFALLCKKCHAKADVQWRKAKESGQQIPECRIIAVVRGENHLQMVPFEETLVPDMIPPTPVLVKGVPSQEEMDRRSAEMEEVYQDNLGTADPYLEGILDRGKKDREEDCSDNWHNQTGGSPSCPSCDMDEDVPHLDGETIAEVRDTGTIKLDWSALKAR